MVLMLISGGMPVLWTQTTLPDTFHITEPAVPNPKNSGWQVDPRLGRLSVTIPIGMMPGEIPFPVSLLMNATPTTRSKRVATEEFVAGHENERVRTTYSTATTTTPVSCTLNLGSISPVPGGIQYTLEDGRVYHSSDFNSTKDPYDARANNPNLLFQAYGFSSPDRRFGWSVSADGSLISYSTYISYYFGANYDTLIKSLQLSTSDVFRSCGGPLPGRYDQSSVSPNGYSILLDKERARIYASYSYVYKKWVRSGNHDDGWTSTLEVVDAGTLYVPICIVDRFGHYVTMQWSVSGGLRRVDVRNQRGQGFTIRMHNGSTDLARIDFVNYNGPSALISGLNPLPWATSGVGAYTRTVWGPETIGRPTSVTLGNPENVPQPLWNGTLGAPSAPPVVPASVGSVPNRVWALSYNGDSTQLASITDPAGVRSTFQTQVYSIYQTKNLFESSENVSGQPDTVTGVNRVDQVDMSGQSNTSRLSTWERQIDATPLRPNAISVNQKDWWDPVTNQVDRYETFGYGDISNPGGPLNSPTDIGNGFLTRWALCTTGGTQIASQERRSRTVKYFDNKSKGSGLNGYLSVLQSTSSTRTGEATVLTEFDHLDDTGLQVSQARRKCSSTLYQTKSYIYNNCWAMLETDQIASSTMTRYAFGAPLTPVATTTNVWDTATPPHLRLQKTFRDAGTLKHGSIYTYDTSGRLATKEIFHEENGTALPSPNTVNLTYDDTTTGLLTTWTATYQDGSASSLITQSQGDFDNGHRPQLMTDEKAVSTRTTYDLYGRPLTIAKDGEAPLTLTYPDEWTRITTQAGKITTENYDGFGHLIKQTLPDGRVIIPSYDLHSRVVKITETNSAGAARTSTTTYDLLDRVVSETSFTGKCVDYAYSTNGVNNIVTQTLDPMGLRLVTVTKTDPFGQVVSVTAPNGDLTAYSYDGMGNKTQVTIIPAGGGTPQNRTFTYDALGRLISKWEPETGTQTFGTFTALNQAQTITEIGISTARPSRVRTIAYDGLGRLRAQVGGNTATTFNYLGALLTQSTRTMGTDTVTQTFAYEEPGKRLSSEATNSNYQSSQTNFTTTINYTYDNQGRLSRLTYPEGRVVVYTYDDLDRVVQIKQNGQIVVSQITYDNWRNPQRRQYGSGAMDEWNFNGSGTRMTQWTIGTVGGTPEARTYAYDAADRLTRAGEWDTLTYDTNSRLTRASGFGLENSLAHDAYNNNTSSVTTSAGIVPDSLNNFTFNPIVDNHLPSLAANGAITQVSEDNFGEITNVGTAIGSQSPALSMTWDGLGRMTSTTIGATGAVESHGYAASGLRVSRIDSRDANLNRIYAYTGAGHLLAEYTASPTPTWARDVVYLGDLAIAEIDSNGIHELHADHQGTPRIVTGSSGAVEGGLAYGPYGELLQQTGYIPLTGYTGHLQTEPTGLIYMRGRFYSPAWHRFMNSNQGVDLNLINHFAYTIGNPLMMVDPTGMDNCPNTDGRSPGSRARGGVGRNGDMSGESGGDPGHSSLQDGRDYADSVVFAEKHPVQAFFKFLPQRLRNLQRGLGSILNCQVSSTLANLMINDPIRYNMITSNDPMIKGIMSGGLIGGIIQVGGLIPAEFAGLTAVEIDALAIRKGLVPKGPSPTTGQGSYIDAVTGEQRVLVHPEPTNPHMHVNDPSGARLDINGNTVAPETPGAHLPLGQP
jgi:RHS repeat-associated protein